MTTKIIKICIVPRCHNTSENNAGKIFIRVPSNATRREQWKRALGLKEISTSSRYCCCEDHFNLQEDAENWRFFTTLGKTLLLKPDVVPHLYLDHSPPANPISQLSPSARKRKLYNIETFASGRSASDETAPEIPAKRKLFGEEFEDDIHTNMCLTPMQSTKMTGSNYENSPSGQFLVGALEPTFMDKGTQVNIKPIVRSKDVQVNISEVSNCPNTESNRQHTVLKQPVLSRAFSSSLFGYPATDHSTSDYRPVCTSSTSPVSELEEAGRIHFAENRRNSTMILMETKSRFYLGLPKPVYVLVTLLQSWCKITMIYIFLTLKKIRLNDAFSRLADDFGIFSTSVPKIANVMQNFVFWPNSKSIKRNLPLPFRMRYSNVQSIIDCLEIEIEKPSNPVYQSLTWSDYKNCNTMKFVISCTPNGFINFISESFPGRITDKNIVKHSSFLQQLPDYVHVMADRGFKQTEEMLLEKNCILIRPPSVSANKQPSQTEVRLSKRISSLRIHVERVIRRMREFEMVHMHSCLNTNLKFLMDDIVIISCGFINVQEPLIK